MSFNLLYGYAGQISLGQQTFFAIGAYAFTMLQLSLGLPAPVAFVGGIVLCAAIALVIGIPLLRLRTHYLAMATLAFALIFYGVVIRWIDFTGGSSGLAVRPLAFAGTALDAPESTTWCWPWQVSCCSCTTSSRADISVARFRRSATTRWRLRRTASTSGASSCACSCSQR